MKKTDLKSSEVELRVVQKTKQFKCPACGSLLCVLFDDFWKCVNGHQTPHPVGERARLLRINEEKFADFHRARWRAMDYSRTPPPAARRADHDED